MAGEGTEQARKNRWDRLNQYRGLFALAFVFLIGCLFPGHQAGTNLPLFPTWSIQHDILFEYCEYGLLATGMTLAILTGGIDLSVGSILGCAATLFALLTIAYGWNIPAAMGAVALFGLAAGTLNGVLIAWFRMQPFVATLVMMMAARGLAKLLSGGIKVSHAALPWYKLTKDPAFFRWMTQPLPGIGLQPATLMFLACILVMAVITYRSAYGRKLYAIGGNEEASRLSGIAVWRVKIVAYALCALFAALAGIVNVCRNKYGDPEAGAAYELDAIAAVVVGGTSLTGGRGGMLFTLLGILTIAYIDKILSLNGIDVAPRLMIKAGIVVLAVLIQRQKRSS